MANDFTYQGVKVQDAYETLAKSGINLDQARRIIGIWIGESDSDRTFGYSQVLTDAEAACSPPAFARTFAHQDWIDGTSVVQAGETPTEQGFNDRFHKIESDLDKLGALVAQSFTCMNSVRQTVAVSLREIANELNRINADLAEIRRALPGTKTPVGPIGRGWDYIGKTKYFDSNVMVFRDEAGQMVNLPDGSGVTIPAGAEARAPKLAEVFGRDQDIRDALQGSLTKAQLVEKFGDRISSDGSRLADLVSVFPDSESFTSLDDMVNQLADRDVALLKGLGAETTLRSSLGIADTAAASAAPVDRIEGVSPALGAALANSGVKTADDLAKLAPDKMVEIGRTSGIALNLASASGLVARGRVIAGL